MEDRKTIFDYLAQVLIVFAICIISMMVFASIFGEDSKEISTMFQLGTKGLAIETMLQFLGLSVIIMVIRYVCFDGSFLSRMTVVLRTILMLVLIVVVIAVMAEVFDWFPVNTWEPWVAFFICFTIYFLVSLAVMTLKTNMENKKLEQGLKKYQEEGRNERWRK